MNQFESAEDYLERILMLQEKNGSVRSIDIANDMNFSKASISIALKKLKEKGFVNVEEHGIIVLTKEGMEIAKNILHRHRVLTKGLMMMGVDEKAAMEDACKLEHEMSEDTFKHIEDYIDKHTK